MDYVPLGLAAGAYLLANTAPVAGIVAFTGGGALLGVWHKVFLWSFPNYVIGAGLAAIASAGRYDHELADGRGTDGGIVCRLSVLPNVCRASVPGASESTGHSGRTVTADSALASNLNNSGKGFNKLMTVTDPFSTR
jgi:hypothetical protein